MEPQYYRLNARGMTLQECINHRPGAAGFELWVKAKLGSFRFGNYEILLLPPRFADIQASREQLSAECLAWLLPRLDEIETLGFRVASFTRTHRSPNPALLDTGGAWLLHATGRYMVYATYNRTRRGETGRLQFTCWMRSGRVLHVKNYLRLLDNPRGTEGITLRGAEPAALFQAIDGRSKELETNDPVVLVEDLASMVSFFERRGEQQFEEWLRRKLVIPLTPAQLDFAIRRMEAERQQAMEPNHAQR